jgi:hypothetical protein
VGDDGLLLELKVLESIGFEDLLGLCFELAESNYFICRSIAARGTRTANINLVTTQHQSQSNSIRQPLSFHNQDTYNEES